MRIEVQMADEGTIDALLAGKRRVGDLRFAAGGGRPPVEVLMIARARLLEGTPAVWCAPWLIVDADARLVVGSAAFKGAPIEGRVEIGYGVSRLHRRRGIATEAVVRLVAEALRDAAVREVYAVTRVRNAASRRVLQKAGFTHAGRGFQPIEGRVDMWVYPRSSARTAEEPAGGGARGPRGGSGPTGGRAPMRGSGPTGGS